LIRLSRKLQQLGADLKTRLRRVRRAYFELEPVIHGHKSDDAPRLEESFSLSHRQNTRASGSLKNLSKVRLVFRAHEKNMARLDLLTDRKSMHKHRPAIQ